MSPDSNPSDYETSTDTNEIFLDNKYSKSKFSNVQKINYFPSEPIIITKHLCEPCPTYYVDYFRSVSIICRDPSHKESIDNKTVTRKDSNQNLYYAKETRSR